MAATNEGTTVLTWTPAAVPVAAATRDRLSHHHQRPYATAYGSFEEFINDDVVVRRYPDRPPEVGALLTGTNGNILTTSSWAASPATTWSWAFCDPNSTDVDDSIFYNGGIGHFTNCGSGSSPRRGSGRPEEPHEHHHREDPSR